MPDNIYDIKIENKKHLIIPLIHRLQVFFFYMNIHMGTYLALIVFLIEIIKIV